ncbi:uncharacterized protein LOC131695398 [Topomyia yanbarensis]|uniref:uncharacterized protein LOC131695398 n=1 Tax=Topomyia yanbarensis TaxID=2498891 RepID=UPI00273BDB7C|nr:uncharacterized protein LOC131695398 [Topomyia yanbarensis]
MEYDLAQEELTNQTHNGRLINSIKKYPAIYAKSSKEFRNSIRKDVAWRHVAEEMQMTETAVKAKWKNLRDRFVKEHREVTNSSSSGAGEEEVYESNWPLYNELLFLAAHCKNRPTIGNFRVLKRQDTPVTAEPSSSAQEVVLEEILVEETELNDSRAETNKTKKRKIDIDERILAILDDVQQSIVTGPASSGNRHMSFGSYLVDRMEMLPLHVARDLEVEFTNRVNSLLDLYADQQIQ